MKKFNLTICILLLFLPYFISANKRSTQWSKVRKAYLNRQSVCAVCGEKYGLQVHHIKPFHLHPELELDKSNFITLCTNKKFNCHLKIGHGGNFRWENPFIYKHIEWIKKCKGDITCMKSVARHIKKIVKKFNGGMK